MSARQRALAKRREIQAERRTSRWVQAALNRLLPELRRVRKSDPPGFLRDVAVEALLEQIDRVNRTSNPDVFVIDSTTLADTERFATGGLYSDFGLNRVLKELDRVGILTPGPTGQGE